MQRLKKFLGALPAPVKFVLAPFGAAISAAAAIPYQRLIALSAGPLATAAGAAAAWLAVHIGLFHALGVTPDTLAHYIGVGLVGVVTAGLTYAGQHKWLSNLAAWWRVEFDQQAQAAAHAGSAQRFQSIIDAQRDQLDAKDAALVALTARVAVIEARLPATRGQVKAPPKVAKA